MKLSGSVADGERSRRYYYSGSSSSTQDTKWVTLSIPQSHDQASLLSSSPVTQDLIKLLKKILCLGNAKAYLSDIAQFCNRNVESPSNENGDLETSRNENLETSGNGNENVESPVNGNGNDVGTPGDTVYASLDTPLIDLILTDSKQLRALLLSLTTSSPLQPKMGSSSSSSSVTLLSDFLEFLKNNCQSLACFRKPLLLILEEMIKGGGRQSRFNESQALVIQLLRQFVTPQGAKKNDDIKKRRESDDVTGKTKDKRKRIERGEVKGEEKGLPKEEGEGGGDLSQKDNSDMLSFITEGNYFVL